MANRHVNITRYHAGQPTWAQGRILGLRFYFHAKNGAWSLRVAKPGATCGQAIDGDALIVLTAFTPDIGPRDWPGRCDVFDAANDAVEQVRGVMARRGLTARGMLNNYWHTSKDLARLRTCEAYLYGGQVLPPAAIRWARSAIRRHAGKRLASRLSAVLAGNDHHRNAGE